MSDQTVLEACMKRLSEMDNLFAYKVMHGVLADRGLYYDEVAGAVRYRSQIRPKKVASLEGSGEGNAKRRTKYTKPSTAAEWACAVLDSKRFRFDRRGWHEVARVGANKVLDLVSYIQALEMELKVDHD